MNFLSPPSLPPDLFQTIYSRSLAAEQILFRQGDAATAFYIVETGRFKIIRRSFEGKKITLQNAEKGDSFGESCLFSETYSYTAIAEVPSRTIAYPKCPLLSALRDHPDLAEDFARLSVKKQESLMTRLELRDIRAARSRVLQYLHYLTEPSGKVIELDRPLKAIADDLGLTPATLSRVLTRLEREGKIKRDRSSIELSDPSVA